MIESHTLGFSAKIQGEGLMEHSPSSRDETNSKVRDSMEPLPKEDCGLEARVNGLSNEPLHKGSILTGHRARGGVGQGLIPWNIYHAYPPNILGCVSYQPPDTYFSHSLNISPKLPLPNPYSAIKV
ncbi:hypothetical protein Acr_02g0011660 [Actinidia rufa]|uniref:Uncharacterized protein n=1 Tax=Actinidia rufa TaxID=165716 RepID=A0A7J0E9S9_9ERIC|nr:hypothetical protein Acr_02g0011660 [Actinidia rufa]